LADNAPRAGDPCDERDVGGIRNGLVCVRQHGYYRNAVYQWEQAERGEGVPASGDDFSLGWNRGFVAGVRAAFETMHEKLGPEEEEWRQCVRGYDEADVVGVTQPPNSPARSGDE
jgi:hypothetical protein